mgnify:CR=1 FL=1
MEEVNKNTISVILPIHELKGDENIELFKNAVTSVAQQEVKVDEFIIVVPKDSKFMREQEEFLKTVDLETRIIINDGKTDFASQINYGASQATSEWISILEFDDEFSSKWFKNVHVYMEAHDDVEIFLPLIIDTNEKREFIGLTNEAAWANSFSDELGFLDNGALLNYQNFNLDGVVLKKELFETFGGLKSNIKLTFIYEFLLRMTFNDVRTMVIPRYGYKHMNQRPGSLFNEYKKEMNPVESNWWLAQAKKEYYFNTEREITYDETQ